MRITKKDIKTFIDFSTGVAVYPRDGLDVDELINKTRLSKDHTKNTILNRQDNQFDIN